MSFRKVLKYILFAPAILLLIDCKSDNESAPIITPDYSSEFVDLREFDNSENYADAIFFGSNGEAYNLFYGDLKTTFLTTGDFYTYVFEDNQLVYSEFGNNAIPYNGGNTLAIPGNSLPQVN